MQLQACPTRQQIDQFVKGALYEDAAAIIAAHLKVCSPCLWEIGQPRHYLSKNQNNSNNEANSLGQIALPFLSPPRGGKELGWLGSYKVLRILGEGGMGIVLEAEDSYLERPVALKVMKREVANMPDARQRFVREAMSMAQLKTAHVVTVYQVGEINDTCFIAMELLQGETLESYLLREVPDLSESLRIAKEIAQALSEAHQKGLIHRDIKPENVFLEGPQRSVKLLDFGLARPQITNTKLTMTGMIMGTPSYMSPEQAHAEEVDEKTDLFSLGCILYQLVTGSKPFDGPTAMSVLISIVEHEPPAPGLIKENIPEALDQLVMSLLAKNPQYRTQSAKHVITAIRALEDEFFDGGNKRLDGNLLQQKISGNTLLTNKNEAERRQVTLLYVTCDMFSKSPEFFALDLEVQSTFLSEFQETCNRVLTGYAGTTIQYLQDSIVVCFGYPTAYEGMTLLAAGCALTLADTLNQMSTRLLAEFGLFLSPRLALHSGPCLIESKQGLSGAMSNTNYTIIGEPRAGVMQMASEAKAGQIIISETSRALLKDRFQCLPLGGKLFELIDENSLRLDTLSQREIVSTGREVECALIMDRWQKALEGHGQIVFLSGETGLGKSHLLNNVKAKITETNPQICLVELFSAPHWQNSTLHPIIKFLEEILGITRYDSQSERRNRLIEHLRKLGIDDATKISSLAKLLQIQASSQYPSLSLSPSREREETFEALMTWLRLYRKDKPLLLIIEDLHWLDCSTLELTDKLLRQMELDEQALVILSFRPEFHYACPGLSRATSVCLNRLTRQESARIIRERSAAGTSSTLTEEAISQICERAGGVPLFIEEFTRMFLDGNDLQNTSGQIDLPIPNTVHELINARLDKLSDGKMLAQTAAVLGRTFKFDLLKSISQLDDGTLIRELSTLIEQDLLQSKGVPPNASYTFKLVLYQDALYHNLSKPKRQSLHRQIAEAILSRSDDDSDKQAEILAHHFAEAGLTEASIRHWILAGKMAQKKLAMLEAIRHYSAGLEMLAALVDTGEPLKKEKLELELLVPLGSCYQAVMGYSAPVVGPILARAQKICEQTGDMEELFTVMWGIWTWHLVRGDLALCLDLAENLLTFALREQLPGMLMEAHVAFAASNFYQGKFELCARYAEEAILLHEDKTLCRRWCQRTGQNAGVAIRCYLALSLYHLGHNEKALATMNDAVNLARSLAEPFSLGHALHFASWLYLLEDKRDLWHEYSLEQMALSKEHGFALWEATSKFYQGALLARDPDNTKKGLESMEGAVQLFKATGASLTLPTQLCLLADAYTRTGEIDRANELLDQAFLIINKNKETVSIANYHCLKGEMSAESNREEAIAHFEKAMTIARNQNNRAALAKAKSACARLNLAVCDL